MTHIDNIRALGNRIVTNLNTMGVSASFSDGALTLADKILDIESADLSNVLLLYADKKIISKDETLELYSLYLEDGLPVSNETITFTVKDKNDTIVETLTGTTNTDGIANVSYLGKGTGDINIQASTNNSIILSKTYVIEDYAWIPKLDGTETKRQISGSTSINNGIMSGGSSYITSFSIDNSKDWEITLDAKFSGNGCGVVIVKSGTTVRDKNSLLLVNNKSTSDNHSGWLIKEDGVPTKNTGLNIRYPAYNTYASCLFKKQGEEYSVTLDKTYTMTHTAPSFAATCPELCIGVDTWGATCSLKNIKVKYL